MASEYGANRKYAIDVDRGVEVKHIARGQHEYTFHKYEGEAFWRDSQGREITGEYFTDAEGNPLEPLNTN
jgi:hypothetical protein